MLQNAYFLAKIGADTAENERNIAEILPKLKSCKTDNYRTGPRGARPGRSGPPGGRGGDGGGTASFSKRTSFTHPQNSD